jgi:hypothetical protein
LPFSILAGAPNGKWEMGNENWQIAFSEKTKATDLITPHPWS